MSEGGKSPSLSSLGEFGLLNSLSSHWLAGSSTFLKGVGDDCAVMELPLSKGCLLLTTDTMVEGRHFLRSFSSARQIGQKLCAVNLSDIAAMGASPSGILVTLQLPRDTPVEWVSELYQGIQDLSKRFSAAIVGGDTVESSVLAFGITAFGCLDGIPIYRSGAQVGDDLWVSGDIGGAGAGLAVLRQELGGRDLYLSRYQSPEPRIALGRFLQSNKLAHSLIDISDGLLQDARHIAEQSNVALLIELDAVPFAEGLPSPNFSCLQGASSGDDYELLFSAPVSARDLLEKSSSRGELPKLTRIGSVRDSQRNPEVFVRGSDLPKEKEEYEVSELLSSAGFQHFQTP